MALALYRKYRPATFADVVGQEHVTEPLRTALSAGRVNHAYLFSGPRGCGKTSSARILARSLNCELGPTPDPCGQCPSCVALAPEGPGNIDVIELDAASHGGVDDARELRDRAFYAPAESRYRVFIVDEAHMVTTQGFNALLKIVEEPPEHLVFVFATTEPDKVLATIRSRTHHYPFRLIPPGTLRPLLERICADEGAIVAPAVFPLVIRSGGGSARDTLSVLDQLLAGAGPEGVTYERAVALLGVTDVTLIDDAIDALAALDGAAVFEAVDRLVEAGHDPRRFAADLLDRLRDLILIQAVPEAANRGLVDAPAEEIERMIDQATRLGAATLSRYAEIVHTGLTEMRGATAPRLLLELLCGRMLLPAASTTDLALLQRLERMERRADIVVDPRPGAVEPGPSAPAVASGPTDTSAPAVTPRPGVTSGRGASATSAPATTSAPAVVSGPAVPSGPAVRSGDDGAPTESRSGEPSGRTFQRRSRATEPAPPSELAPATEAAPASGPPTEQPPTPAAAPRPAEATEAAPPPSASAPEPAAGSSSIDAAAVRRAWPAILDATKLGSRSTGALLVNAAVKAVEGDTLVLAISAAPLARRLSEQRNTEVISAALRSVLGVAWHVRCEQSTSGAAAPTGGSGGGSGGSGGGGTSGGNGAPRQAARLPQRPAPERPSAQRPAPTQPEPPQRPAPSAPAPSAPARQIPTRPSAQEPPLPSEPPPYEPPFDPEYDEEDAVPDRPAGAADAAADRRDPEEVAIELLSAQLGARAVEDRR